MSMLGTTGSSLLKQMSFNTTFSNFNLSTFSQLKFQDFLKAQYRPLCFAHLCCCFGFLERETSIVYKFYSGDKQKPQNFQHHKNGRQEIAAYMLSGQYRVFNLTISLPKENKWPFTHSLAYIHPEGFSKIFKPQAPLMLQVHFKNNGYQIIEWLSARGT